MQARYSCFIQYQKYKKQVWIYLAVSIVVTILGLWLSMRIMTSSSTSTCGGEKSFVTVSSASRYVLAVLLSQGNFQVPIICSKEKSVFRNIVRFHHLKIHKMLIIYF